MAALALLVVSLAALLLRSFIVAWFWNHYVGLVWPSAQRVQFWQVVGLMLLAGIVHASRRSDVEFDRWWDEDGAVTRGREWRRLGATVPALLVGWGIGWLMLHWFG